MSEKKMPGINGVLSHLLTPVEPLKPSPSSPAKRKSKPKNAHARLGRPLAGHASPPADRDKLTVRISKEIIADYRDRSWDVRCSLSSLVETALSEYRRKLRR